MISRRFLLTSIPTLALGAPLLAKPEGTPAQYDGGSLDGFKKGEHVDVVVTQEKVSINRKDQSQGIPVKAITEISYGREVHRRVGQAIGLGILSLGLGALLLFSKKKTEFIGLTFDDGGKKGGFVLMCKEHDYRGLLTSLEGVTGKKAVNSETMNDDGTAKKAS